MSSEQVNFILNLFLYQCNIESSFKYLLLSLDYYLKKADNDFHRTVETCCLINH